MGLKANRAARYQANKERDNARVKAWKRANPTAAKGHRLKMLYGLSAEEYGQMLAEQGGGCALCSAPPTEQRALAVDHCHTTNKVRALLCHTCNNHLGIFERRRFEFAAYVEKHSG